MGNLLVFEQLKGGYVKVVLNSSALLTLLSVSFVVWDERSRLLSRGEGGGKEGAEWTQWALVVAVRHPFILLSLRSHIPAKGLRC